MEADLELILAGDAVDTNFQITADKAVVDTFWFQRLELVQLLYDD